MRSFNAVLTNFAILLRSLMTSMLSECPLTVITASKKSCNPSEKSLDPNGKVFSEDFKRGSSFLACKNSSSVIIIFSIDIFRE